MSYEHQHNRSTPPPAYSEAAPGGMEGELYIDGTLYVDGVPVSQSDQQRRGGRIVQRRVNPCDKILRLVRSNIQLRFFVKEVCLRLNRILGNTTNGKN